MTDLQKIAEGRTAEIFAWEPGKVLKLYRPLMPDFMPENEFRHSQMIWDAGFRNMSHIEGLTEVDGRKGIVMDRVEGQTMLQAMQNDAFHFLNYTKQLADLHTRIHRIQEKNLPEYHDSLLWRLDQTDVLPATQKNGVRAMLKVLPRANRLLHGDFHPDNLMLSAKGVLVIDWMDTHRGHPLADVARTYVCSTATPSGSAVMDWQKMQFAREYVRAYRKRVGFNRKVFNMWLVPVAAARLMEGIPGEEPYLLNMIEQGLRKYHTWDL